MTLVEIVEAVSRALKDDPRVHAMWLEGSYATGRFEHQSDIDVWLDVDDDSFDYCVRTFRSVLSTVNGIRAEHSRGIYSTHPKLAKHLFFLDGHSDEQRIEVDLQEHSRQFVFSKTDHALEVLFDKDGVIRWQEDA
jgi:predicted nucleotidyltransferase